MISLESDLDLFVDFPAALQAGIHSSQTLICAGELFIAGLAMMCRQMLLSGCPFAKIDCEPFHQKVLSSILGYLYRGTW